MNDLLQAPSAAYIHIPFCVRKCNYCDFISFAGQPAEKRQAYVLALRQEIRLAAAWAQQQESPVGLTFLQPLQTVFFGGGTPTVMEPGQLAQILDELAQTFGLAPDSEITLEANPGTVSADSLAICRLAGFNRISFGLQAFQPHLLQFLGRLHSPEDFLTGVDQAVRAGFRSINVDIMYGVPGQSIEDIAATLQILLPLPINHLSFYSLSLEEGTPMQALAAKDPDLMPPEDLERAQYHLIRQTLTDCGFDHYEISNAARPGSRCRHNLVYWQGRPYYGFGVAAHSFIQGIRRANTADLDAYIKAQAIPGTSANESGAFATAKIEEVLDEPAAQKEMILLGLRLLEGVHFADFKARFGSDLRLCFAGQLERLAVSKLLYQDDQGIRLSTAGLDLANQVFMEFV
jgi:oxygen-independent coproporphyrinogen III oxidase